MGTDILGIMGVADLGSVSTYIEKSGSAMASAAELLEVTQLIHQVYFLDIVVFFVSVN